MNVVFDFVRAATGIYLIKIKKNQFLTQARNIQKITDTQLFGPQDNLVEAVDHWLAEPNQSDMSASGIILFNGLTVRLLNTRQWVIEYIQANREHLKPLEKPVIISGLPRTGSTMLYNLLSCDPNSRTPRFFEMSQMANPMPPTTFDTRENDPRIKLVANRFEETETIFPGMWTEAGKSHRSHPNEIEEDLLVLFQSFILQLHVPMVGAGFRKWYEDENNKDFAYRYHKLFFQALNAKWTPNSHWVFKAPVHSTYLPSLVEHYPDARLIFTHRDPVTVVPSWTRFLEAYLHWSYLDYALDRVKIGRYILDSLVLCANRLLRFRETTDKKYFDLDYDTFVKDPVSAVKEIYKYHDLEYTQEFEDNMKVWITENRQGKYGRREYSLNDYKLTNEIIDEEFAAYNSVFFPKKDKK